MLPGVPFAFVFLLCFRLAGHGLSRDDSGLLFTWLLTAMFGTAVCLATVATAVALLSAVSLVPVLVYLCLFATGRLVVSGGT